MRIVGLIVITILLPAAAHRPAIRSSVRPAETEASQGIACRATGAPRDSLAVVALTDGGSRIVVLGSTTGELVHSFALGPVRRPPPPTQYPAGSIALAERSCEVIVAAVDSVRGTTRVLALSLRDWQLRTVAIIADTAGFPWVEIGDSSGRIYLMGRKGIEVLVLDRASGRTLARVSVSRPGRAGGLVYRARVSPNERRVYLSYHGGLDWVDLAQRKLCSDSLALRYRGGLGCQEDVHGDFDFSGNDVVAATGGPWLLLLDSSGVVRKTRSMNLVNGYGVSDHFMWPSVDTRRGIAYGTIGCALGQGVMSISLADSAMNARPRSFADSACGQHIAPVEDGSTLIVLESFLGQLMIVDASSGKIARTIGSDRAGKQIVDVIGVAVEHSPDNPRRP